MFLKVPEANFHVCFKKKFPYSTRFFTSSFSENNSYPVKTLQGSILYRSEVFFGLKKLSQS